MTVPAITSPQQAAKILAAFNKRHGAVTSVRPQAFPRQLQFMDDASHFKACVCTRRAGKSEGLAIYLVDEALKAPDSVVVYAGLVRESARRVIEPKIRTVLRRAGIKVGGGKATGVRFNRNECSFHFPNGSVIYIYGADAREEEREKFLGQAYKLVVVDEAGSFSTDLGKMIKSTFEPTTYGPICLVGTPQGSLGFFYKVTEGREPGWSIHRWSALDNPYEAERHAAKLKEIEERDPGYMRTDEYKRDWLGQWVVDSATLIYRYDESVNSADALPKSERWQHVIGVDPGFTDDAAFVVCAFNPYSKDLYVVEASKEPGLDWTAIALRIRRLIDVYEPYAVVVDKTSASGIEEMRVRHDLPLERAENLGKFDHIALMNADLQAGRIKLLPSAAPLAEEWMKLEWDLKAKRAGIRKENASCANHCADACLYAWRRCVNYASQARVDAPRRGSEEEMEAWWEREAERIRRADRDDDPWSDEAY